MSAPGPVPSYFNAVANRGDTLKQVQTTPARQASNDRLTSRQFPVGWLFFSHANVERLLSVFRPKQPHVEFEHLQESMLKFHETVGLDERIHYTDRPRLSRKLGQLNQLVIEEYGRRLDGKIAGQQRYARYVKQPYVPGTYNRVGEATSIRDRSMYAFKPSQGRVEEEVRTAPPFVPQQNGNRSGGAFKGSPFGRGVF